MTITETTHDRTTKYISAVRRLMAETGHATNGELQAMLRKDFADISATTVHRITSRMLSRGELLLAPSGRDNILRFDANLAPHDHFMCNVCGLLRDAHLSDVLSAEIEKAIGNGCSISGSLTVSGICKNCQKETS